MLGLAAEVIYWSCNDLREAPSPIGKPLGRPRARNWMMEEGIYSCQSKEASAQARGETGRSHVI
jgi:hypothetical protein